MIYIALILVLIMGAVALFSFKGGDTDVPSSGYTYLKFKDGVYIGTEKLENGNIKAEVTIENEKVKDIKIVELPKNYLDQDPDLKTDISKLLYEIIETQEVAPQGEEADNQTYVLNKVAKAVRNAMDQSLIEQ